MTIITTTAVETTAATAVGAAPASGRRTKGLRRIATVLTLAAITMFGTLVGGTGTADAWAWSSHVKVAGNISCENRGVVGTPRVSIRLNHGESGSASVNWLNNDGIQFRHIPSGGTAGTILRNYFVEVNGHLGQRADDQIDCLADVGTHLFADDESAWVMRNGYAMFDRDGLERVDDRPASLSPEELDEARGRLRVGVHRDVEVTTAPSGHVVTQVHCSALPVAYNRLPAQGFERFARLVVEAAYEATLRGTDGSSGRRSPRPRTRPPSMRRRRRGSGVGLGGRGASSAGRVGSCRRRARGAAWRARPWATSGPHRRPTAWCGAGAEPQVAVPREGNGGWGKVLPPPASSPPKSNPWTSSSSVDAGPNSSVAEPDTISTSSAVSAKRPEVGHVAQRSAPSDLAVAGEHLECPTNIVSRHDYSSQSGYGWGRRACLILQDSIRSCGLRPKGLTMATSGSSDSSRPNFFGNPLATFHDTTRSGTCPGRRWRQGRRGHWAFSTKLHRVEMSSHLLDVAGSAVEEFFGAHQVGEAAGAADGDVQAVLARTGSRGRAGRRRRSRRSSRRSPRRLLVPGTCRRCRRARQRWRVGARGRRGWWRPGRCRARRPAPGRVSIGSGVAVVRRSSGCRSGRRPGRRRWRPPRARQWSGPRARQGASAGRCRVRCPGGRNRRVVGGGLRRCGRR